MGKRIKVSLFALVIVLLVSYVLNKLTKKGDVLNSQHTQSVENNDCITRKDLLEDLLVDKAENTFIEVDSLAENQLVENDSIYIIFTNLSKPSKYDREYDAYLVFEGIYNKDIQIQHPVFSNLDEIHYSVYVKKSLNSFCLYSDAKSSYSKWENISKPR